MIFYSFFCIRIWPDNAMKYMSNVMDPMDLGIIKHYLGPIGR